MLKGVPTVELIVLYACVFPLSNLRNITGYQAYHIPQGNLVGAMNGFSRISNKKLLLNCCPHLFDKPIEKPRVDGLAQRLPKVVALLRVLVHGKPLVSRLWDNKKKKRQKSDDPFHVQ